MKNYPPKCPNCKEYLEPIFNECIGNYGVSNYKERNTNQEPIKWKCDFCGYEKQSKSKEKK